MNRQQIETICNKVDAAMCDLGLSGRVVRGGFVKNKIICEWEYGVDNKIFIPTRPDVQEMTPEELGIYLSLRLGHVVKWSSEENHIKIYVGEWNDCLLLQ